MGLEMTDGKAEDVEASPSGIEGLRLFAVRVAVRGFGPRMRLRRIAVARGITPDRPLREDLGGREGREALMAGRAVR